MYTNGQHTYSHISKRGMKKNEIMWGDKIKAHEKEKREKKTATTTWNEQTTQRLSSV